MLNSLSLKSLFWAVITTSKFSPGSNAFSVETNISYKSVVFDSIDTLLFAIPPPPATVTGHMYFIPLFISAVLPIQ